MDDQTNDQSPTQKLVGMLAQFDDPDALIAGGTQAREAGYKKMDAYTPFPVPAAESAIGIRRSFLPFFVLAIGIGGCFFGLAMQWYANAADSSPLFPGYAYKISGKPYFSIPANIPVVFEVTVLSSAFAAFLGMWALNRLPRLANPLHRISRFKRATNDKFFLMIEADDEHFDQSRTERELNEWGASAVEPCYQDLTDVKLPSFVNLLGVLGALLLLVPPVLIFRAAGMTHREPRLHVIPDMDYQHKYKAQQLGPNFGDASNPNYLFGDPRAARPPIPGTIARGQLENDIEYYQGIKKGSHSVSASVRQSGQQASFRPVALETDRAVPKTGPSASTTDHDPTASRQDDPAQDGQAAAVGQAADDQAEQAPPEPDWVTEFPDQVKINEATLRHGQQRYEIYCAACHGYSGQGDGLVNQRAMALAATGQAQWTAAKSYHDPEVKKQPVGRIYDTITNGRNTMGPYRSQIPVEDRWAIVAYVKALQATGIVPPVTAPDTGTTAATPNDKSSKSDKHTGRP